MGGTLQDYTIDQLAGATALICGSLGGLLMILWKSKCKKISCCYLITCDREITDPQSPVPEVIETA